MMPEIFWSCTLADNGLSIWTTKNASCCGQKLYVVTGCGRLWSVFVMSLEVLAINAIVSCNGLMEVWKIKVMDLWKN